MSRMNFNINTNVHSNGKAIIGQGNTINVYSTVRKRSDDSKVEKPSTFSDKIASATGVQETNEPVEDPNFIHVMRKGFVAVVHNILYSKRVDDSWRKGSEKDASALRKFFENDLGFKYREYQNLKAEDLQNLMEDLSEKDYSKFDAFFCVILSHGNEKGIVCVDENTVAVDTITNFFTVDKCESLMNKPKIFIIQACRGFIDDPGANVEDCGMGSPPIMQRLPVESDFLISYSSPYGYTSFRNINEGSWFISSLIDVFIKHYEKDHFLDLLLRVNFLVMKNQSRDNLKQMPSFECRLSKKCYLQSS